MYRFLYILNWIVRGAKEHHVDPTSWVWGTIQTALMVDFAWVYYTRQRVKLRHGGVVDSDDFGRGWLINRFVGRKSMDLEFDQEESGRRSERTNGEAGGQNQWGRRGISVSADEGVEGAPRRDAPANKNRILDPEQQPLADPAAFEDESDDEAAPPPARHTLHESGVRGGDEWTDDLDDDAREHDGVAR
jgi:ER lumen protein retaining receptor